MNRSELAFQVVAHHLRIFGIRDAGIDSEETDSSRLLLLINPVEADTNLAEKFLAKDGVAIAIRPAEGFCVNFGVKYHYAIIKPPAILKYRTELTCTWSRLRTLHEFDTYQHTSGTPVVTDANSQNAWMWLPSNRGGVLFVGTDVGADLTRYRQGDPEKEKTRRTDPVWGYPGERPLYLFEGQIEGENPSERHADWWAMALAQCLADRLGKPLVPLLPGGAAGAVVVTGDDDQAYLEKYREQLSVLQDTPITYFLHPQTRHNRETLREMLRGPRVDLGLHPDALDAPDRYAERLAEQVEWYRSLVGEAPLSVRNHGFLNDGYWRHGSSWLKHGIRINANLPGLDGRILNGSLLPARVAFDGRLTPHWSILTAIGDGVRFISGMSETGSTKCVYALADSIRQSGVPGIMVLNLHPQNVGETRAMHEAAMEVIKSGFHPWTIRQCLEWFELRDAGGRAAMQIRTNTSPLRRMWNRVRSNLIS